MADYIMNDDRDAKDILIELRESTGMNRHQFCDCLLYTSDAADEVL